MLSSLHALLVQPLPSSPTSLLCYVFVDRDETEQLPPANYFRRIDRENTGWGAARIPAARNAKKVLTDVCNGPLVVARSFARTARKTGFIADSPTVT